MKVRVILHLSMLAGALVALGACSEKTAPQQPTPQVDVLEVHPRNLPLSRELVGRLAPTQVAEVRARVAGIILERVYDEGSDVKRGDVLFRIDPAPLKATLRMQKAALASARATAHNDAATAKRYKTLAERGVIAKQDLDNAAAKAASSAAAVQQAAAAVATAKLNLSYATVTAPISGRAGRALVTQGALVGDGSATKLTTVQQIDPIYVDFSMPQEQMRSMRQQQAAGNVALRTRGQMPVHVTLSDGTSYPQAGTLDFSDMAVDPQTGSVSLRAALPNPERNLLPGMFVHVLLTVGSLQQAFVVPQQAVLRDAQGTYVLLVDDADKVSHQSVTTHGMRHGDWIITAGLHDGDAVIVKGLQKVHVGAPVKTSPYTPASDVGTSAPAQSTSSAPASAASSH